MKFVSEEGQEATKVLPWIPATKTAGPYDVDLEIGWTEIDQMTSLRTGSDTQNIVT
jgi:hypothetical protein